MSDSYDDYESKMQLAEHAWEQALEEKQEPVAWRYKISPPFWTYSEKYPNKEFAGDAWDKWQVTPLYAAPPKKQWVGLTDDEIEHIADSEWEEAFVRMIEAKLREKNHG
jgi:hypothetical protein